MNKRRMFRQGDVLVVEIDDEDIPKKAKVLERDRLILARGEATGHHHSIISKGAVMYALGKNLRAMRVQEPVELVHQEHLPIELPAGSYQIIKQREYTPKRIVNVVD